MRPIKFRAWDIGGHTWYDLGHFSLDSKCALVVSEHMVIEQFTGLLDKNGRDIYEGDILNVLYGTQELDKPGSFAETCKAIIRWSGCSWEIAWAYYCKPLRIDGNGEICWRSEQHGCSERYAYYKLSQFEVVGNLHENPEMVKA